MTHRPDWVGDASLILLSLLVQGIPFLLLGAMLGGLITTFVPITSLLRGWLRHPILSATAGALSGGFLPACDCAVVPVVRRLVQNGVPVSAGVAYLLAAPALNPICLVSTFLAFRMQSPWHMIALRAGGSFFLAVIVGLVAARLSPALLLRGEALLSSPSETSPWMRPEPTLGPFWRRLVTALGIGLTDFLNMATLYVLGALGSALLQTFLPLGRMFASHGAMGIPAAMFLAFLLSLCSSADAFVVNSFGALGLAGQLAFLWLGPIYNFRILFVYRNLFRLPAILGLGAAIILLVAGLAFLVQRLGLS